MKTRTCRQLAGACDLEFHADTFEEVAELSKSHAMQMAASGDKAHIGKMQEMSSLMSKPEEMSAWFENVKKQFAELPEDK